MTTTLGRPATARLAALAERTDPLGVAADGVLGFAGVSCAELAARFGTPLHLVAPATMRANLRGLRAAAGAAWPAPVALRFSVKAGGWPGAARVAVEEGAGLEVVGRPELDAALTVAEPDQVVAHGSARTDEELLHTARSGAFLMLDSLEETRRLAALCRSHDVRARVGLRLKLLPDAADLAFLGSGPAAVLGEFLRREKWGMTLAAAVEATGLLHRAGPVRLVGCGVHLGRTLKQDWAFGFWGRQLGRALAELHRRTGWWPAVVDLGGGWARRRDPNPDAWQLRPRAADEALPELLGALGRELTGPAPELWLEPGRYAVGNAALTLASVVAVKHDAGLRWLLVDLSTNFLPRVDTSGYHYVVLPAGRMHAPDAGVGDVAGPTCVDSRLGADLPLPALDPGDLLAVLDTGMYTLSAANRFNGLPLPRVVTVGEAGPVDVADMDGS